MKTFLAVKHPRLMIAFAALMLAILACTCGDLSSTSTTTTTGGSGDASVTVTNSSGQTICYVFISPTTNENWGPDQLGDQERIEAGSSRTFNNIAPGQYDLRAEDCDQNQIDEERDLAVSGAFNWNVDGQ